MTRFENKFQIFLLLAVRFWTSYSFLYLVSSYLRKKRHIFSRVSMSIKMRYQIAWYNAEYGLLNDGYNY